jgi:hypothetical protein
VDTHIFFEDISPITLVNRPKPSRKSERAEVLAPEELQMTTPKNNEERPKTKDQINKRGPSAKQCKGKKALKRSERKRENSSSTSTEEPHQRRIARVII